MTIGENIKKIADEKNISMYRIAKEGKISQAYVSNLLSNQSSNPTIGALRKIAKVLGVTVNELIREEG